MLPAMQATAALLPLAALLLPGASAQPSHALAIDPRHHFDKRYAPAPVGQHRLD